MASKILDILVDIEMSGVRALEKAGKSLDKFDKTINKTGKSLKKLADGSSKFASGIAPITAGLTAATAAFVAFTKSALNSADAIAKTADRVGLSTDALQELRVAASLSGVEARTLDMAIQRFSRRVAEAAKQQERLSKELRKKHLKEHISQINTLQTELTKSIRGEEKLIETIADLGKQIVNVQESTSDKVRNINRRNMDDVQKQADLEQQANEKLAKAKSALIDKDYDRAIALAQQSQDIFENLENESIAVNGVQSAGKQLEQIYEDQRNEAKKALEEQKKISDDLRKSMDKLAKSIMDLAEELRDLADIKLDVNAKEGYKSINDLTKKIKEANKLKLDVSPSGKLSGLAKEFNTLGIALTDANGRLRSTESLLNDYADAIKNADTEQEKLRLAFVAFDSEGAKLVNTLRNGSEGLEQSRQKARELGLVIEEDLLRGAEKANDAMYLLSNAVSISFQKALITLQPTIIEVVNALMEFLPTFQAIIEAIGPFLPAIIAVTGALASLGVIFITVINPLIQIISLVGAAIAALGGFIPVAIAVGAALLALWLAFNIEDIFHSFVSTLSSAYNYVETFVYGIIAIFENMYNSITGFFNDLIAFIPGVIAKIGNWLSNLWSGITGSGNVNISVSSNAPGLASGGKIPGYGGGDKVRALLEAGEFVMKKESVKKYGSNFFNSLNNMTLPKSVLKFQEGGLVPSMQTNNFNFSAPITNNGGDAQTVDAFRKVIIPELKRAMTNNTMSIASLIKKIR